MKVFGLRAISVVLFAIVVSAAPVRIVKSLPTISSIEVDVLRVKPAHNPIDYYRSPIDQLKTARGHPEVSNDLLQPDGNTDIISRKDDLPIAFSIKSDGKMETANMELRRKVKRRAVTGMSSAAVAGGSAAATTTTLTTSAPAKVPISMKFSLWIIKNATKNLVKLGVQKLWKLISDRIG